jgi:hypothetical protein
MLYIFMAGINPSKYHGWLNDIALRTDVLEGGNRVAR